MQFSERSFQLPYVFVCVCVCERFFLLSEVQKKDMDTLNIGNDVGTESHNMKSGGGGGGGTGSMGTPKKSD